MLAAALFVNGETLPGRKGDRHATIRNVGVADELGDQVARWTAHGEHRRHGPTENRRDPGHIDTTAARVVTGAAATYLVGRADLISARHDVERRIHSEGDDRCPVSGGFVGRIHRSVTDFDAGIGSRTTSTGTLADCATALLTEPNHVLAKPPRPRLPTTTSWAF